MTDGWRYRLDVHKMFNKPKKTHLFDKENRMKLCQFIEKYVIRLYGTYAVSAWLAKYKEKTIFNMITMSNFAFTVAVVENRHETWDEMMDTTERQGLPKTTAKFTKKG
jgi:hypothetical protein